MPLIIKAQQQAHTTREVKEMKATRVMMSKDAYKRTNKKANYLVCADCITFGETERLDEAIRLAEKNWSYSELKIYEYSTGAAWIF